MRGQEQERAGLQEKGGAAGNEWSMRPWKRARIFGEIMLWALWALSVNLLAVFVQNCASWSPLVASGRMTLLQAAYVECAFYFTGHRYGGVLAADFPGPARFAIHPWCEVIAR